MNLYKLNKTGFYWNNESWSFLNRKKKRINYIIYTKIVSGLDILIAKYQYS